MTLEDKLKDLAGSNYEGRVANQALATLNELEQQVADLERRLAADDTNQLAQLRAHGLEDEFGRWGGDTVEQMAEVLVSVRRRLAATVEAGIREHCNHYQDHCFCHPDWRMKAVEGCSCGAERHNAAVLAASQGEILP